MYYISKLKLANSDLENCFAAEIRSTYIFNVILFRIW